MSSTVPSLWSLILNADFMVKIVMMILLGASIASWAIIIQRGRLLKQTWHTAQHFEQMFWSGIDLTQLYQQLLEKKDRLSGMASIFYAGFQEYTRLRQQEGTHPEAVMKGAQRAMRIAATKETENLEQHLPVLATVGSTCPFVGIFGTVWGIMAAFRALGAVQQASIAMVAPGISEALITTAIGLFAAIPAVVAYNRLSTTLDRITQHYDIFQEECWNILNRKAYD